MSLREVASGVPLVPVIEELSASVTQALQRLAFKQKGPSRHRQPVAVIGPGDAGAAECAAAYAVAHALAGAGMVVICGGRGGVMAAASRGACEAGGIAVGILPEDDDSQANEWLSVAVPTGMGEMRNAIIARSGVCLVAIGSNLGTLSEMAMGLKWGKPVFVMHGDIELPGAIQALNVDDMLAKVLVRLLG
ncbi:MAG: TIGR00725 family protein [Gammaproteobacteria bacterium]|uniref:TIGR00725 family protein n=1 Tax=Acidovorax sp. TaxID=1872122 RepID=UPI001DEAF776|nr:TIGR00725 family protein [Gammaproteobacteria bacterium]MBU0829757.1 TIGR00725 family protein [Gammaproteobacteria bacterium]MBU0893608.1 TIGR00725 family protein [Gammaproteobacteria bacterium]MBU1350567.1 TIGR00725 family protein [Gammaproteobacteria bacterium]MBU1508702.1 TIGR00725 family protein [Gammaproteobacteria bacterium]